MISKIIQRMMGVYEFSRRCAAILIREISPFAEVSLAEASASASADPTLPDAGVLQQSIEKLINSSIASYNIKHIVAPSDLGLGELLVVVRSAAL